MRRGGKGDAIPLIDFHNAPLFKAGFFIQGNSYDEPQTHRELGPLRLCQLHLSGCCYDSGFRCLLRFEDHRRREGLGTLWWGRVGSVSVLFVALSSPFLGSIADKAGVRKKMLLFYTYLSALSPLHCLSPSSLG
jgi:MFS family permease